jgi:hypothetical protein
MEAGMEGVTGLTGLLFAGAGAGLAAVMSGVVKSYVEDWMAFFAVRQYDFDNNPDTPDKAEQMNPASGEWAEILITKYKPPWGFGYGGVVFHSWDAKGKAHVHEWTWREWRASRTSRRTVGN